MKSNTKKRQDMVSDPKMERQKHRTNTRKKKKKKKMKYVLCANAIRVYLRWEKDELTLNS